MSVDVTSAAPGAPAPPPAPPGAAFLRTRTPGHGMPINRLEGFTDAVFAIVITLLVLDLPKPPSKASGVSYAHVLSEAWETYFAYVVSFLIVGMIWLAHGAMFRIVQQTPYSMQVYNLLFLLPAVILPWPTTLLAAAGLNGTTQDKQIAVVIFGATMTLVMAGFNLLWHYLTQHPELRHPWVTGGVVAERIRRYRLGLVAYPTITILGLISLPLFLVLNLALAVVYLLPTPDLRT
jgi:uncharacterized membrane protein